MFSLHIKSDTFMLNASLAMAILILISLVQNNLLLTHHKANYMIYYLIVKMKDYLYDFSELPVSTDKNASKSYFI